MLQPMRRIQPTQWNPLKHLKAQYLEFTETSGVLRLLTPQHLNYMKRGQGILFECPCCKNNITALFEFPTVPLNARPAGRWNPKLFPIPVEKLSLKEWIGHHCGMQGWIKGGALHWEQIK